MSCTTSQMNDTLPVSETTHDYTGCHSATQHIYSEKSMWLCVTLLVIMGWCSSHSPQNEIQKSMQAILTKQECPKGP